MNLIVLNILLLFNVCSIDGEGDNKDQFSIEWIEEFSNERDLNEDDGIFSNLVKLVTGDSKEKLLKPFNVFKLNEKAYFILDQGLCSPVIASDVGFEIIENEQYNFFPSLVGVCKFKNNEILFTDSKLSKVFLYDIENKELNLFPTEVTIRKPTGIAYDKKNKIIYVTETDNHRILAFSETGQILDSIGTRGQDSGQFNYPSFITLDDYSNLYVVDALNFRIQIFDKQGRFIRAFGKAGDATGYFNRPKGISIDSYGHIYIVDAMFHTIQIFDNEGNFLYNFGGLGTHNSRFWLPIGIDIDNENNITIADSYNGRIQIFRLIDGN